MGHPRKSALFAHGLRAVVTSFREESRNVVIAKISTARLEGRFRSASGGVAFVEFSRQHRRGAGWWRDGTSTFSRQGPHRLFSRHRCCGQCWRCLERDRRYHNDNDVDRRRAARQSGACARCFECRLADLWHPGGQATTQVFADLKTRSRTASR